MSSHTGSAESASTEGESHAEPHAHPNYVKVWAILLVLLVVSVAGPELGIRWVTLFTAFGIAVIKAYLVAKNFMHLDVERRIVVYILTTCLALMLLFFFAVSPDVMRHIGANWENTGAQNMKRMVEEHHGTELKGHGEEPAHSAPVPGEVPAHSAPPASGEAPGHGEAPAAGAGAH